MTTVYHNPKEPSRAHLETIKERFEVGLKGLVVKTPYHKSPNVGEAVGAPTGKGYMTVKVLRKTLKISHIVIYLETGKWPTSSVDNIDGDLTNNSFDNLRQVSHSKNHLSYKVPYKGVTSEYRGVSWDNHITAWKAQVKVKGKTISFGYHTCETAAAFAYREGIIKLRVRE